MTNDTLNVNMYTTEVMFLHYVYPIFWCKLNYRRQIGYLDNSTQGTLCHIYNKYGMNSKSTGSAWIGISLS